MVDLAALAIAYAALSSSEPFVQNFATLSVVHPTPLAHWSVTQVDDELTVESKNPEFDIDRGLYIFRGGVRATYGPTVLTTDTLLIRPAQSDADASAEAIELPEFGIQIRPGEGYALGSVKVTDPDVRLEARNLQFRWLSGQRFGSADDLVASIGPMRLQAKRAEMRPDLWTLTDVKATTCNLGKPTYEVAIPTIKVTPGKAGVLERPSVSVLGQKLVTLGNTRFSLDPRTPGPRIPSVAFRRVEGFGVTWTTGQLLDDRTQLLTFVNAFQKTRPNAFMQYTKSNYGPETGANLQPISDLSERAFFGFFNSIYTAQIEDEHAFVATKRANWTLATSLNLGTYGRVTDFKDTVTRPADVIYEFGGKQSGFGFYLQGRAGAFSANGESFKPRSMLFGHISAPVFKSGRTKAIARFDFSGLNSGGNYGFLGVEAGLQYNVWGPLSLAAGVFTFRDFGAPDFAGDLLNTRRGVTARVDFNSGPTKISYLYKYDAGLGWFDREYRISQVIGCIEPLIIYRQVPQDVQFGVRFRIDEILGILQQRDVKRRAKTGIR